MNALEAVVSPNVRPPAPDRLTYTVAEAARALGISRGLAYEMTRQGGLPSLRLGQRRILVPRGALDALLGSSDLVPATSGQGALCH